MEKSKDAISASAASYDDPDQAEVGANSRRTSKYVRVALVLLALVSWCAIGVVISPLILKPHRDDAARPTAAAARQAAESLPAVASRADDEREDHFGPDVDLLAELGGPAEAFIRADQLLRDFDIPAAARIFQELAAGQQTRPTDDLRYRLAICAEQLGDLEPALAQYQQLSQSSIDTPLGIAARLGQARVAAKLDQASAAASLLGPLRLVAAGRDLSGEIQGEIAHLIAHVRTHQASEERSANYLSDTAIAFPRWITSPAQALAFAEPRGDQPAEAAIGVRVTRRFGDAVEDLQLDAQLPRGHLAGLLQTVGDAVDRRFVWSQRAQATAGARSAEISVRDGNLADVLDDLVTTAGLSWQSVGDQIVIQSQQELEPNDLTASHRAAAERALRYAVTAFPEHPASDGTYINMGNLAFSTAKYDDAVGYYGQVNQLYPRSEFRSEVWFNYAKAQLNLRQLEPARDGMLRVVDEGRGHALEKYAYRYLGRIALEAGEVDAAIKPLLRAVAAYAGAPGQAGAVVDLAAAYVMAGRPGAANSVLAEHRKLFTSTSEIDRAALLGSIARFDTAVALVELEKAGREVVAALSHVQPTDFFGYHGYLLLGRTYERLGLFEPMQQLYLDALQEQIGGELRSRILQELAMLYLRSGRRQDAVEALAALSQSGADHWQRHALTTMAELALTEGRLDQSMMACRDLLQVAQTPSEKARLLQLMGRIYQRENNHYFAALCFAGMLPGQDSTDKVQSK